MFGRTELEELRLRKQQLAAQSEANRSSLAADWRKLKSPGFWMDEAFGFARQHPLGIAAVAAAGGTMAFKLLRRPGMALRWIGKIGKLVPVAVSAWKLFNQKKPES